ncbi:MAG: hypothetical protein IT162_07835 [Bryobacterales bacterium]|nr:hypothetical protein [Bryobacterales bacterium]
MDAGIHPNDQELFRAVRAQLTAGQMRATAAHLAGCPACRARMYQAERQFQQQQSMTGKRNPAPPPRAPGGMPRMAAAAGLLLVSASVLWTLMTAPAPPLQAAPLPNPEWTPGAVRAVDSSQICAAPADDEATPRRIGPAVAHAVFEKYRIGQPTPGAYELDYLITPDLGGSDDVQNLWPQPYDSGLWNARVKDALEDKLRELVCAGKLDLKTAQRELAADWIAAYRKHFGRLEPLAEHRRFVKDQPWHE